MSEREPLLPLIAKMIREWFPEVEGRSLAVSEAEITRENMPTLPLAMVALIATDAEQWVWQAASSKTTLIDDFMVEFWLKPIRYDRADGSESPFWAYYDYELWRDKLLSNMVGFFGPRGQRIEFVRMTIESDQFAVVLSFRFRAHYKWCADLDVLEGDGLPPRVDVKLCQPVLQNCGDLICEEEADPCP